MRDVIAGTSALDAAILQKMMAQKITGKQAALEEIQTLTEESIQDLQRVIRALRPLYLEDLGLVASLQMLARETAEIAGLPIDFAYSGVEERLSLKTELAYYRIAQEGLSNI